MGKILILGGNVAQVPLIEAAKREGYYVVLVDYTTTNPGIALVDKHYQVNFMDRERVLEIAREEKVEGVISNSEAAMTVVAYISEQLNLVGNTLESVSKLSSKIGFRILQKEIGVFVPEHVVTASFEEACQKIDELRFPIVIKPSKSSGSRGTTKVSDRESFSDFREDWEACSKFSLDGKVVLEEFVQMQIPGHTIEVEVFVCNGQYLWDGIFTNLRRLDALSIPMTNIFPPMISDAQLREVRETVQKMFRGAGIVFGEYNIELFYTPAGKLFCIEINPRQGGSGMPDLVGKYSGVDMYRLLVTTAMGDDSYFKQLLGQQRQGKFVVRQEVFSRQDGILQQLSIAPDLQPYVIQVELELQPGEKVEACRTAEDMIGFVDLEFESREQQLYFLERIEEKIYPVVKQL